MVRSVCLLLAGTTLVLACGSSIAGTPKSLPRPELLNFHVAEHAAVRAAYYDSLRVCRLQHPGRLSYRVQLSPSEPSIARCLKRRDVA
jgi:hypothetical protein